jgi:hypothetical protein
MHERVQSLGQLLVRELIDEFRRLVAVSLRLVALADKRSGPRAHGQGRREQGALT